MNEFQQAEIRDYLLSQKLPIDILLIVQDHFISQIQDLEREKHWSFDQAFEKTKKTWFQDLHLYWNGGFSLEDSSDFIRKARRKIEFSTIKESLKIALPIMIFLIVFSHLEISFTTFNTLVMIILLGLLGILVFNYVKNFKDFRLAKKYPNYILTLHQHSFIIFVIAVSPMLNIIGQISDHPEILKTTLSTFVNQFSLRSVFILISVLLTMFCFLYSIIGQRKYLQQILKIKPFVISYL